jgi:hypothetical protein
MPIIIFMQPFTIGLCTEVFRPGNHLEEDLQLIHRVLERRDLLYHNHYNTDFATAVPLLNETLTRLVVDTMVLPNDDPRRRNRVNRTRKDKVNILRQNISWYLQSDTTYTLRQIAKYCSCHTSTVKKVRRRLSIGDEEPYEYNNLHSENDLNRLKGDITDPIYRFYSINDYKRRNPVFSKKRITKEIKLAGKKWKRTRQTPQIRNNDIPDNAEEDVLRTMAHIVNGITTEGNKILFVDEVIFQLNTSGKYCWTRTEDNVVEERAGDNTVITAIVMCSKDRFEFMQLYQGQVSSSAFLYFLQKAMTQLPINMNYSILLDNAPWHHTSILRHSAMNRFLHFNLPRQYQLNMIENSFSAIKCDFRRRVVSNDIRDEINAIHNLFQPALNDTRFIGYYRHYVDTLDTYCRTGAF